MGFGIFYEVDNAVEEEFKFLSSKEEWYDSLSQLNIGSVSSLDAEDSIPGWEYTLRDFGEPISAIFSGDLSTEKDASDDPHVIFLRNSSVKKITSSLSANGRDYFEKLLLGSGCEPDIWLYAPMLEFFASASRNNKSIVVMWGG